MTAWISALALVIAVEKLPGPPTKQKKSSKQHMFDAYIPFQKPVFHEIKFKNIASLLFRDIVSSEKSEKTRNDMLTARIFPPFNRITIITSLTLLFSSSCETWSSCSRIQVPFLQGCNHRSDQIDRGEK